MQESVPSTTIHSTLSDLRKRLGTRESRTPDAEQQRAKEDRDLKGMVLFVMITLALLLPVQAMAQAMCYSIADSDKVTSSDVLIVIDATTGVSSQIGALGTLDVEAAAFALDGATLYAADGGQLGTVDLATGAWTAMANPFGTADGSAGAVALTDVDGLTVDPRTGIVYGVHRTVGPDTPDLLFQIDPASGAHVPDALGLGVDYVELPLHMSLESIDGLAIDPTDGQMYAIANDDPTGYSDRLVQIDKATGAITDVGSLGAIDVEGLSFHNDGTLYATTGADGSFLGRDRFYSVDKATGAATVIAPLLGTLTDYEALACMHEPPNTIEGTVFSDEDADAVHDEPAEGGVPGVTVELYLDTNNDGLVDAGDVLIQTTVTDGNGDYTFLVGAEGNFVIATDPTTLPGGTSLTTDNVEEADFVGFGNTDADNDFGVTEATSIGNRVWLDENSDGLQNPGEPGLAGVTVELLDAGGTVIATTTTDTDGGYLFDGLIAGDYQVRVDAASLPAGLTQTPTTLPGQDFGNQAQPYAITLVSGEENLTADFGYNWNPTPDVDGNTGTATLGDSVWIDADGDGVEDPDEAGAGGVLVHLISAGPDGLFGTPDDVLEATTTTEPDGSYIFDGLDPDAYVVEIEASNFAPGGALEGYTQTGDPDHFGTTGLNDNQTTSPVILGPGDVILTTDFGYQPPAAEDNSIGDTIFFDADADEAQGPAEPGIPGVTVALIADDGDGLFDPAAPGADEIIATATTDDNGNYLFEGLPDGHYVVWVNDTDNVLAELEQTADPDGLSDGQTAIDLDSAGASAAPVDDLDNDFGYTAADQEPGDGLIGDTVYLDADGDGTPDPGEGLEGVTVELLQGGLVIATTTTDENGNYSFGDLDPNGTYDVRVDTATLPPGLVNTADPDDDGIDGNGDEDAQATVDLSATGPVDLDQDFGFAPAGTVGSIGDQVFLDTNGDGVFDGLNGPDGLPGTDDDEAGIEGVTVDLYLDADGDGQVGPGDSLVGSTETNAFGNYAFEGLPADGGVDYVVVVTDEDGVLAGYQQSLGPDAGDGLTDDNGQLSPYAVTLTTANPDHELADFGFYLESASIGNFVWQDLNGDGLQDPGEPGLENAVVTLTVDYPDGSSLTVSTTTDATGFYSFDNLLLDEDFDGTGTPGVDEPSFTLSIATPAGYVPTGVDANGNTQDFEDSDDHTGTAAQPTLGATDVANQADPTTEGQNASYDFGFQPTATLGDLIFDDLDGDGIQDPGEPGIPGVTVELIDDGGTVVATTVTDGSGNYTFTDIPPGDYSVRVTPPPGYEFAPQDQGGDDTLDSDADPATGETATLTLTPGENNQTTDIGLFQPASIGDTVWQDLNGNGIQDAGEPGIPNVTVELLDVGGTVIASATTDFTGNYLFDGLIAGDYSIRVTSPAGTTFSPQDQGADEALDSDVDPATGETATLTLAPGENNLDVDAGIFQGGTIGNQVFEDLDGDGIQDPGEPGIPGVTVELLDDGGTVIGTVVTDENGEFLFDSLPPGDYQVRITPPEGSTIAPQDQGGDDTLDSDVDPVTGTTPTITLGLGEDNLDVDAGLSFGSALGNRVWLDENSDGFQNAGEPGLAGVTVELLDTGGSVLATTLTDGDGGYLFEGLAPGDYQVRVDAASLPAGLSQTALNLPGEDFGNQAQPYAITLTSGDENLTGDFGYNWNPTSDVDGNTGTATLGDRVWIDADGDGAQDAGEPGADGVVVNLITAGADGLFGTLDDVTAATTTTDADGRYIFDGLMPDAYGVEIDAANFSPGGALEGYTQTGDPDHFGTTGANDNQTTDAVVLGPGDVALNVDFGYQPPPAEDNSIGDTVFFDADGNGTQDPGESGIPGVTVTLIADDGDGVFDPTNPGADEILTTVTTDENGNYLFEGLPDGTYVVWVNDSDNVLGDNPQSADPDGLLDDQTAVDLDSAGASAAPVDDLGNDFGYTAPEQDPGEGLIGDTVFLDADGNGQPDPGEGLEGVTVELLFAGEVVATTTTDENGNYHFGGLDPLAIYTVQVDPTTLPAGLVNTVDPDDDGTDGNGDEDGASTVDLALTGPIDLDQDFGYEPAGTRGSIGNTVFNDSNGDGVNDGANGPDGLPGTDDDEPGIDGVTVALYLDENGDGQVDAGEPLLGTAITDANGNYSFEGLPADGGVDYVVVVTDEDGVLAGYQQTVGPDAGDGLTDDNAQQDPYAVTLTTLDPDHLLADFGFFSEAAAIGNFVWNDTNGNGIQDAGELGIENATVTLTVEYPDGTSVSTDVQTDANGFYSFGNLLLDEDFDGRGTPGVDEPVYTLSVATPAGHQPTVIDANGNAQDLEDSENPAGTTVQPTLGLTDVTAQADPTTEGQNASYDFGFVANASLGDQVFNDLDGDGIQDPGEPGIPGVTVELIDAGGTVVDTVVTDGSGNYTFTDVTPGDYTVRVTPPAGFDVTQQDQGGDDALDSDADPATGETAPITLVSGENNVDTDIGLYQPASLGDTVWLDINADGIQDAGEPPLSNVTVELLDAGGTVLATEVTDLAGNYAFTGLVPGDYTVRVVPPIGSEFSPQDQGADDALDSDVDPATGETALISLAAGENRTDIDAGLFQYAEIGDQIWNDLDGDGVQDPGEPGVPGVVVELIDDMGTVVDTVVTDETGTFTFTDVLPGDYQVRVTPPDEYDFTDPDQGGDDTLDSDTDPVTGLSPTITVTVGEVVDTVDTGLYLAATLGNRVWLDENSDGLQDAGEPGLAGITVELLDAGGTVLATTTTDAEGGYLFENLPPGDYQVQVDGTSLPAGMSQTALNLPGQDFGNQAQPYAVTLTSGDENLTADFGYNWNPTSDVDGNTGTATLGDSVWIDADGDGVEDPGETGAPGVVLNLITAGPDGLFGTPDDVVADTTTSDANGRYIFDDIAPDAYVVEIDAANFAPGGALEGYTQTGDPDHFGTTGANDDQTTDPVVLGPGDVFLNVDFGYQPPAAEDNSIGDTVFLDPDGNGAQDAGEPGIAGVSVTLIADDGDGLFDPANPGADEILATVTTDENGNYLFEGLPDGNYVVWVNDSDNVLGELDPSADPDGLLDEQTAVDLDSAGASATPVDDLGSDFGYTPPGQDPGDGVIGDTVFLDADGNGQPDPGEGLEGVTVELIQGGQVIGITTTDENGHYTFGDLDPNGTYTVQVDPTTLPPGLVNTTDPDDDGIDGNGDEDGASTVDLSTTGGVDLDQDFGYTAVGNQGSIGNTIWLDSNADGLNDGANGPDGVPGTDDDEPGLDNVTVELYLDSNGNGQVDAGEPLMGSTATDANGSYLFNGLPADSGVDYVVVVTDENGVLAGYQASVGPNAGDGTTDDNAQTSPYAVSLSAAEPDHRLADFGYFSEGAAIGNRVWEDLNGNGLQDVGEIRIAGATVTLEITYPDGTVTTLNTLTDGTGFYSFGNLLLDEDFDGSGTPGVDEPIYRLSVATPPGYAPTVIDANGNADDQIDSEDPAGTIAQPVLGLTDVTLLANPTLEGQNASYDFGFQPPARLGNLVWEDLDGDGIQELGENGLAFVLIELLDDMRNLISTTFTDASGNYTFSGLTPGDYAVRVTPPAGYAISPQDQGGDDTLDSDADPATGETAPVTLVSGENNTTIDVGLFLAAALGDTVFDDLNGNGIQDAGEPGVEGATLELLDAGGLVIATTTSDVSGNYAFTGLAPGDYSVRVTPAVDMAITLQDQGADDALDNDFDPATGETATITLASGETNNTVDAGLYTPTTIGNLVFEDLDGDGIQDADEPGIPGVMVDLLLSDLTPVATVVTDANGNYSFLDLAPGDYVVAFTPPAGFTFSPQDQGADDELDSDADPATGLTGTITVAAAEVDNSNDAGMIPPPTEATISRMEVCLDERGRAVLHWQTDSQVSTAGFFIDLYKEDTRRYESVHAELLASLPGAHNGASYYLPLSDLRRGQNFTVRVTEVENRGQLRQQGTFTGVAKEACDRAQVDSYTRVATELSADERRRLERYRNATSRAAEARTLRTGPAVKIAVEETGLYRVDATRIAAALGQDLHSVFGLLEKQRFSLTLRGEPVAWKRSADGKALVFFGQAIRSKETRENIYRLEPGFGQNLEPVASARVTPSPVVERFATSEHYEENRIAAPDLAVSADEEIFRWATLQAGHPTDRIRTFDLRVEHPAAGQRLTVTLQGATETRHRAEVSLNGRVLGEMAWKGSGRHEATFAVDASDLRHGDNTVLLTAQLEPGEFFSLFHLESFALDYEREYRLQGPSLLLHAGDHPVVTLHGIGSPEVEIYRLDDPNHPVELRRFMVRGDGRGFTVSFPSDGADTAYLAVRADGVLEPTAVWAATNDDLVSSAHAADYLLITNESLANSLRPLADLRQSEGFTTRIVTLEAIYDTFNHGIVDPDAIRTFLHHASTEWSTPVRFVTLIGDGSYDPLDHLGYGGNVVPVKMVATPYGNFASDLAYVDFDGDRITDLPIGRLPVLLTSEVDEYIADQLAAPVTVDTRMTAAADFTDAAGLFSDDSEALISLLPQDASVHRVYLSEIGLIGAREQIFRAFQRGDTWVNYIGHSSLGRYSDSGLLTLADVPSLQSPDVAPLVSAWACASNRFAVPGFQALGEALILAPNVGSTVVSAVGLSQHDQAMVLARGFYQSANRSDPRIGEALLMAIQRLSREKNVRPDMLQIYQILGESLLPLDR